MSARPILAALVTLATALSVSAQTIFTWTGNGTAGDISVWTASSNWDANGVPGTGTVALGPSNRYEVNLGGSRTLSGLTFAGPGAYTLYGGTITLGGNGLTANGEANHYVSANIQLGSSLTYTIGTTGSAWSFRQVGNLTDAGAGYTLTKAGNGTLELTGTATLTGGTVVSAGTLQVGNGGTAGALDGALSVASGATLRYNRSDSFSVSGLLSGTGTLAHAGGGTVTFTNSASTFAGSALVTGGGTLAFGSGAAPSSLAALTLTDSQVNFGGNHVAISSATISGNSTVTNSGGSLTFGSELQSSGTTTINSPVTLGSGGLSLTSLANNSAVVFNGVISGSGELRVNNGGSVLYLNGANTYTGGTYLAFGKTIEFTGAASFGTGDIFIDSLGGTLRWAAGNNADISSRLAIAPGSTSRVLTFDVGANSVIFGSGLLSATSFAKTGTGTLQLNAAGSQGTFTISEGTLVLGHDQAVASQISVGGGATLAIANGHRTISNTVRLTGGGTAIINTGAYDLTLSSALSTQSVAALQKSGTGNLNLLANSARTAATTVDAGFLGLGGDTAAGSGAMTLDGGGLRALNADRTVANAVTIASGGGHLDANGQSFTFSGALDGAGPLTLGGGTLLLSGTGTRTGPTQLDSGTLVLGHNSALGSGQFTLAGGTLRSDGTARSFANTVRLEGDATLAGTHGALTFTGPLTLDRTRELTVTGPSPVTFSGTVSGTGRALNKFGAGTLVLTGANTYTGGTYLDAGTTRINNTTGSAFGTGAVTVASGATLTGAGSFTGALQLNGLFSPGNSPGITSTGSQTWAGGAGYIWEINQATGTAGTHYDLLSITGTLAITATSASPFAIHLTSLLPDNSPGHVINFNPAQNYTYTLATASSGITGFSSSAFTLDSTGFTNALNGGTWSLAAVGNDLNLTFTASAIPEPSTYAALLGALSLAVAWRRRVAAHRQKRRTSS